MSGEKPSTPSAQSEFVQIKENLESQLDPKKDIQNIDELVTQAKAAVDGVRDRHTKWVIDTKMPSDQANPYIDALNRDWETAHENLRIAKENYEIRYKSILDYTTAQTKVAGFNIESTDKALASAKPFASPLETEEDILKVFDNTDEVLSAAMDASDLIQDLEAVIDDAEMALPGLPKDMENDARKKVEAWKDQLDGLKQKRKVLLDAFNKNIVDVKKRFETKLLEEQKKMEEYKEASAVSEVEMQKGHFKADDRQAFYDRYIVQKKKVAMMEQHKGAIALLHKFEEGEGGGEGTS